jgi:hypothetical protein
MIHRVLLVLFLLVGGVALAEAAPCTIVPTLAFHGALTTTPNTVLYTVPTGKIFVTTSVLMASNATGTTVRAVTIKGDGVSWVPAFGLAANQALEYMNGIVLTEGKTITGWQGVGTDVDVTISGALYTCP